MRTAVAIMLCWLVVGCMHVEPTRSYEVKAFTIKVMNPILLKDKYFELTGKNRAIAFYLNRVLYVPYSGFKDKNKKPLPDFCDLGHELWHLPELGDLWHD